MKNIITRLALAGLTASLSLLIGLGVTVAPADAASACGQNLQCVIAFGDARIAERVTALNLLIVRVNAHQYLTSSQKSLLVNDANTNISGLNTLKTKIDADTSVATARADVQSIYTQFRIFAVVLPRDYAEVLMDHESNVHDSFVTMEPKLQSAINQASSNGVDVTQEQQQYQDLVSKVNDAATQIANAQALLPDLIPANYPGTAQTFQKIHGDLKQGHLDLAGAYNDAREIVQELKTALGTPTSASTATPAATPTAVPTS